MNALPQVVAVVPAVFAVDGTKNKALVVDVVAINFHTKRMAVSYQCEDWFREGPKPQYLEDVDAAPFIAKYGYKLR